MLRNNQRKRLFADKDTEADKTAVLLMLINELCKRLPKHLLQNVVIELTLKYFSLKTLTYGKY